MIGQSRRRPDNRRSTRTITPKPIGSSNKKDPHMPRKLLGIFILTGVVVSSIAAYALYSKGAPGTPELLSSNDHISVYTPSNIQTDFTLISVPSLNNEENAASFLGVTWSGNRVDRFYFTFNLNESARGYDYTIDDPRGESRIVDTLFGSDDTWNDDNDYVIVEVTPKNDSSSGGFQVRFIPHIPFAGAENARLIVQSPRILSSKCPSQDANMRPSLTQEGIQYHLRNGCKKSTADTIKFTVLWPGPGPLRPDYTDPQPIPLWSPQPTYYGYEAGQSTPASWSSNESKLSAAGSFTDIGMEASGQRLVFFAGILAGFAGGLLPFGVELLSLNEARKGLSRNLKSVRQTHSRHKTAQNIKSRLIRGDIILPAGMRIAKHNSAANYAQPQRAQQGKPDDQHPTWNRPDIFVSSCRGSRMTMKQRAKARLHAFIQFDLASQNRRLSQYSANQEQEGSTDRSI